jgi:Reverse transcriptase (RNA-dependent DNA polymerase)
VNTRINKYFKENVFIQCPYEHALYMKKKKGKLLVVVIYVDDLIFMGDNVEMVEKFKEEIKREFKMMDLGLMKYFLDLEVRQGPSRIVVSQETYSKDILKKNKMTNSKSILTPMEPGAKLSRYDGGDRVDSIRY